MATESGLAFLRQSVQMDHGYYQVLYLQAISKTLRYKTRQQISTKLILALYQIARQTTTQVCTSQSIYSTDIRRQRPVMAVTGGSSMQIAMAAISIWTTSNGVTTTVTFWLYIRFNLHTVYNYQTCQYLAHQQQLIAKNSTSLSTKLRPYQVSQRETS